MNDNSLLNNSTAVSNLVKNPLGIIGLFILLVYGIASLLLGLGGKTIFSENQIWLIIIFLVLFPAIVLYVFYELVTKNHQKLYSPKDYHDDKSFLDALGMERVSEAEREQKLENESLFLEENQTQLKDITSKSVVVEPSGANLTAEIGNITVKTTNEARAISHSDRMKELQLLEEQAIIKLEKKFNTHFDREVKFNFNDITLIADGGYKDKDNNRVVIVEIMVVRNPIVVDRISGIILKCIQLQQSLGTTALELVFGLIIEDDRYNTISRIQKLLIGIPINIQIEYFNILDLKKEMNDL